jgi:hypothetical protein
MRSSQLHITGLTVGKPGASRGALALRAMPIATTIIGDAEMTAVIAALDMAAECRGPAGLNRRHDLQLGEAQMPCLNGAVVRSCGPEDIGDLQRGGLHDASAAGYRLIADESRHLVERTGHGTHHRVATFV